MKATCPRCSHDFDLPDGDHLKAEALDRLAESGGAHALYDAAKILGMKPKRFTGWLLSIGWIFRRPNGRLSAMQPMLNAGYLRQKVIRMPQIDGTVKVVEQVLVNPKGLTRLAQILEQPHR